MIKTKLIFTFNVEEGNRIIEKIIRGVCYDSKVLNYFKIFKHIPNLIEVYDYFKKHHSFKMCSGSHCNLPFVFFGNIIGGVISEAKEGAHNYQHLTIHISKIDRK